MKQIQITFLKEMAAPFFLFVILNCCWQKSIEVIISYQQYIHFIYVDTDVLLFSKKLFTRQQIFVWHYFTLKFHKQILFINVHCHVMTICTLPATAQNSFTRQKLRIPFYNVISLTAHVTSHTKHAYVVPQQPVETD